MKAEKNDGNRLIFMYSSDFYFDENDNLQNIFPFPFSPYI